MQNIGDVFSYIQENNSIPNKTILTLMDQYKKKPTHFINSLEQCFIKIMKSMLELKTASKKQYEIFEKLTEKFFNNLHNNTQEEENEEVYGNFFKKAIFFLS